MTRIASVGTHIARSVIIGSLVRTFSEVLAPPVGSESALQKPVIPTAPAVSGTPSYCKSPAPALCTTEQLFYERTMAVPNST
jgi:hypothetical protein